MWNPKWARANLRVMIIFIIPPPYLYSFPRKARLYLILSLSCFSQASTCGRIILYDAYRTYLFANVLVSLLQYTKISKKIFLIHFQRTNLWSKIETIKYIKTSKRLFTHSVLVLVFLFLLIFFSIPIALITSSKQIPLSSNNTANS